MILYILLLTLSSTISMSEPRYEKSNDVDYNILREDLMNFVKQLFDNSTDDLEVRIEILENDVESLELTFNVLLDEVIEIQAELVNVGNLVSSPYQTLLYKLLVQQV